MPDSHKNGVRDTSLGGKQGFFPQTTWNLVARLGASDPGGRRAGLETLCERYWRPVYCYFRVGRARTNEDSKDLTQAFFLWLIEGEALANYQTERGGFRRYLKSLLQHFDSHEERARSRLKRGGGTKLLPLHDDAERSYEEAIADPRAQDPESVFDRVWKQEVVRRAMARVRKECAEEGKEAAFHAFEEYDLAPEGKRPTHEQLAGKLGLDLRQLRHQLDVARKRVRSAIRSEIIDDVANDGELEAEWKTLIGL